MNLHKATAGAGKLIDTECNYQELPSTQRKILLEDYVVKYFCYYECAGRKSIPSQAIFAWTL